MDERLSILVSACMEDMEACRSEARRFFQEMCSDRSMCVTGKRRLMERYSWIDKIIERGVPDGRSRLILYVVSRYLVNVKGLSVEDAERVIGEFIENSCRNHGDCSKIYNSWIRNVLRKVADGGWLPWSLERIREQDPELYAIVESVISG